MTLGLAAGWLVWELGGDEGDFVVEPTSASKGDSDAVSRPLLAAATKDARFDETAAPVESAAEERDSTSPVLHCRVIDFRGMPVAGATVKFWPSNQSSILVGRPEGFATGAHPKRQSATTDAVGKVAFYDLAPGRYELAASTEDAAGWSRAVVVDPEEIDLVQRQRDIELVPCRRFAIVVKDESDEPIESALVALVDPDSKVTSWHLDALKGAAIYAHGITNAAGQVQITALRDAIYRSLELAERIDIVIPRFGGKAFKKRFELDDRRAFEFEVTISRPVTLEFQLGEDGAALPAPGIFINSGEESQKPHREHIQSSSSHPSVVARAVDRLANHWAFEIPEGGLRLAAFEPNGKATITIELPGKNDSHQVVDLPAQGSKRVTLDWAAASRQAGNTAAKRARVRVSLRDEKGAVTRLKNRLSVVIRTRDGEPLDLVMAKDSPSGCLEFLVEAHVEGTVVVSSDARVGGFLGRRERESPVIAALGFWPPITRRSNRPRRGRGPSTPLHC